MPALTGSRAALVALAALALSVVRIPDVAAAPPADRVVLADPDPELRQALITALAPWRLEIVVDAAAPGDDAQAQQRADRDAARFVVWRRDGELVVFDRAAGTAEHRAAPRGVLDPVAAAAAALTVKTLMRLPPPPPPEGEPAPPEPPRPRIPPPADDAGAGAIRVQAGLATRLASGVESSTRLAGAAMIRPSPRHALRLGLAADFGSRADVSRAGFKGSWHDWTAIGVVSWTFARGPWELEPLAGAGVISSTLEGVQMTDLRRETELLATIHAGLWLRRRLDLWTIGAGVELGLLPSTPTYTKKDGTNATIFDVPAMGTSIGVVVAADLGP